MLKYTVEFNDGEIIKSGVNLDEAERIKDDVFHNYISRYAIITRDGKRVNISDERKLPENQA